MAQLQTGKSATAKQARMQSRIGHPRAGNRLWLRVFFLLSYAAPAGAQSFRPPAVPLVTHDPYFSVWSMADHLNGEPTKHWTGKNNSITGFVRVDGRAY